MSCSPTQQIMTITKQVKQNARFLLRCQLCDIEFTATYCCDVPQMNERANLGQNYVMTAQVSLGIGSDTCNLFNTLRCS